LQWALDPDPPTYASHVVGMTDALHYTQFVAWDKVLLTFARLALNRSPPDLCLISSWDYKHELLCPT
jgi:hypothetical protein